MSHYTLQTDHDPRNPAYIATQGPLATTTADFWQLVWEQGSVVIVMLTKLNENGHTLCHHYWPQEGSQLYHIYEVQRYSTLVIMVIICYIVFPIFVYAIALIT